MSGTIYCTILVARAKTCAGILSPKIRHVTAIKSRFKERRKRLSSALPFYNQLSLTDPVNRRVDKRLVIFFGRAGPLSGRKPLFFARKFAGRRVKVSHFVLFEVKYIHRLWRLTKKRRKKKKGKNVSYERCAEQNIFFHFVRAAETTVNFNSFSQNEPHVSILKTAMFHLCLPTWISGQYQQVSLFVRSSRCLR